MTASDGVVCFAGVDWWYHNRGHSECQVMRRLAGRVPVLWVNSLGMRTPIPGRTELALHRYARKLSSAMQGLRRDASGMWVYSPLFVPVYRRWTVALNGRLVGAQVEWIKRRLGMRRPAVWVTVPTAAPAALSGGYQRMVFNRCDDFATLPGVNARVIRPLEDELIARADCVLYVNHTLRERERDRARQTRFLDHGVDFEHFAVDRGDYPGTSRHEMVRRLPRPIIGFYGALDEYTIDQALLVKVARRFRHGTVLVMGPKAMDLAALQREPNVKCLGPVPYDELPACASEFDVGLMPWRDTAWIAGCNPVKLKEYLALGFPVVSTPFDALAPYRHLVSVGATHEAFVSAIERALADDDPLRRHARRNSVAAESWDRQAAAVADLLGLDLEPLTK